VVLTSSKRIDTIKKGSQIGEVKNIRNNSKKYGVKENMSFI